MRKLPLKLGIASSTVLAILALSVSIALANSPHFISAGTASILTSGPNVGAYQVANFKEAGLGNTMPNESITLSATANATYACINGGCNHPKATNKQSVTGQVTKTGSFPIRNGSTTGTLSAGPPPAGPFSPPCSPPQTVALVSVSYTNVVLTGLAGDTSPEPNLSACLFPGIGVC